jgi:hypothetical protein
MTGREARQKQILFGNDSQKGNCNCNRRFPSGMTTKKATATTTTTTTTTTTATTTADSLRE